MVSNSKSIPMVTALTDPRSQAWLAHNNPQLSSKTVLITGATSGIGYALTHALTKAGAQVLMAVRSEQKAEQLHQELSHCPHPPMYINLELDRLSSCQQASTAIQKKFTKIDWIFANAGIAMDANTLTATGLNKTFFVNHIGHFAFIGQIISLLRPANNPRIILQSSLRHWSHTTPINFADYFDNTKKSPHAYADSKLANVLFAEKLQRLCHQQNWPIHCISTHPGLVLTSINKSAHPPHWQHLIKSITKGDFGTAALQILKKCGLHQPSLTAAALAGIQAATQPQPGRMHGPSGWFELCGTPSEAQQSPSSKQHQLQDELWELTENYTQINYC